MGRILKFADRGNVIIKAFGATYFAVALPGFVMSGNMLLGIEHINYTDKWIHAGLAVVSLDAGFLIPSRRMKISRTKPLQLLRFTQSSGPSALEAAANAG